MHRRRWQHCGLQGRDPHPRQHRDGPRRPLPLPRHIAAQVRARREVSPRSTRPSAAHSLRRLLAQADLSQPDVARRRLHGRTLSRRIRRHLPIPRRLRRHRQTASADGRQHARSGLRPPAPRLGRVQADVLGRQDHRPQPRGLGTRHGLVRDGPRRYARLVPPVKRPVPSATRRAYRRAQSHHGRGHRGSGRKDRTLVAGHDSRQRAGQFLRGLRKLHVHLRAGQGRAHGLSASSR